MEYGLKISLIAFAFFSTTSVILGISILYLERHIRRLNLRLALAEKLLDLHNEIKKKFRLTKKQKDGLDMIFLLGGSRNIVRSYFWHRLMGDKHKQALFVLSELEIHEGDKLFDDAMTFMFLCALKASTHNFILGVIFRRKVFGNVLLPENLVKMVTEHKEYIRQPDVFFAFSDMLKLSKIDPSKVVVYN